MNKRYPRLQRILDLILVTAIGLMILALARIASVGVPSITALNVTVPPREASLTPTTETTSAGLLPYPPLGTPADLLPYPPPSTPSPVRSPLPTLTPSVTPTATPTPLVMPNGWYLYEDPDGEFSLTYPQNAFFDAGQNELYSSKNIEIVFRNVSFKTPTSGGYQGMTLSQYPNPKHLSAEQIAVLIYERSGQRPAPNDYLTQGEVVKVSELSALKIPIPPTNTEITLIVATNDRYYLLAPVHGLGPDTVDAATLELFYQVVNTLVITPRP